MDFEKEYNEMVRRAMELHESGNALTRRQMEIVCPQLAESEDERIRKKCMDFIRKWPSKEDRDECLAWLEKQKDDRMKPIYDARESFESALEKAWNDYHNGYENVDKLEDDYVECAHAKGFREGYLFGIEKQKEVDSTPLDWNDYKDKPIEIWNAYIKGKTVGIEIGKQKEQKPVECKEYLSPDCGTTAINVESDYDRGYREGKRFQIEQTERYSIGKTFAGLIPCWVNAPSELQPAHKYHGRNVVIMHENNGGFRCVCIDDEKPATFHLPEDTLFAEGWRKKPVEWSVRDGIMLGSLINYFEGDDLDCTADDVVNWLKSLRPSWKPSEEQMSGLLVAIGDEKERGSDVAKTLKSLYEQLKQL